MTAKKIHTAGENLRDPGGDQAMTTVDGSQQDAWLQLARDAFSESTDYFNANIRKNIERNLAHFNNRHAPGSKYYSALYKARNKGFRPKTRSMVRKKEAAAAKALFSTADVVHVSAEHSDDEGHRISAEINQELLQYRLSNTLPWFLTAIGAYQDTLVGGVCISHQDWAFDEQMVREFPLLDEEGYELLDEETGEALMGREYVTVKDTPWVDLRPVENVLFSTAADWRDPMNSSPFIIDKIPMTIDEVIAKAKPDQKTRIPWFELTVEQLLTGVTEDHDAVRNQREGNREDATDQSYVHHGFRTVWVHRNIMRYEGEDLIFYTLGTHYRLSDPIPLIDEYPHLRPGERPYVLGFSNIEAHKNYPESITGLSAGIQQVLNDRNNQRGDNVELALNRRYIVNRNANIDYAGLQRNVPGGVTEVDNVQTDIRIESPPDVTASSYHEQDRGNLDFDEVTGHFSTSSVGSNRQMNETVGGMNLLSAGADELTEYPLRVFVETWVQPVLKQLIRLEQRFESDEALLNLLGDKLNLWQRFGLDDLTDEWIQGSMNVEVNVGFGASNPMQRIEKLTLGLNTILQYSPEMAGRIDGDEVAAEVMGALGYAGTERFFPSGEGAPPPQAPMPQPMSEYEMARLEFEKQKWADELNLRREQNYLQHDQRGGDMSIREAQIMAQREKTAVDRQNRVDEMKLKMHPANVMRTGI